MEYLERQKADEEKINYALYLIDQGMSRTDAAEKGSLIYSHVNPYGSFKLDMMERIPIEEGASKIKNTLHL